MGNEVSTQKKAGQSDPMGSAILATAARTLTGACGSLRDTFDEPSERNQRGRKSDFVDADDDASFQTNPMSQMFARALISEAMGNMSPAEMAEREKALLKAQQRAKMAPKDGPKPIGAPGLLHGPLDQREGTTVSASVKHRITIGVCLSRRHSSLGHPDTITRQTAFDFNELQDRHYQYVSSTDEGGWRAGGGENGGSSMPHFLPIAKTFSEDGDNASIFVDRDMSGSVPFHVSGASPHAQKVSAPDTVHIPIIDIDCESQAEVESIIATLARGEVFIPHMAILPISLGVSGSSPPDLVTNFICERSDDIPPDEWPNWCLEFMHNQLYEYFLQKGAQWMSRPFQITLARKVRWKTAKHMNKYFTKAEAVFNRWRENGPQYLDPQLTKLDGGATPEEVSRPHGIYLLRSGIPTNYFPPNISPPYSTKLTRNLLSNVIEKSWDKKRRDWSSEPIVGPISPASLLSSFFGCNDTPGFLAIEATQPSHVGEPMNPDNIKSRPDDKDVLSSNNQQQIWPQRGRSTQKNLPLPEESTDSSTNEGHQMRPINETISSRNGISPPFEKDGLRSSNFQLRTARGQTKQKVEPFPELSNLYAKKSKSKENPVESFEQKDFSIDRVGWETTETSQSRPRGKESKHSNVFQPFEDDTEASSKYDTLFEHVVDLQIPENNATHHSYNKKTLTSSRQLTPEDEIVDSLSPSEGKGGESQTTEPTNNASSAKFIQQEREKKKQRETERERERKKVEELEKALRQRMTTKSGRNGASINNRVRS